MSTQWDFQQAQQVGQVWLDMCSRMGAMFNSVQPGAPPTEAARQLRGAVFKNMSEQAEQFMRSEQFLEAMKQSMDRTLETQKQYQAFMTNLRHATEGVAAQDVQAVLVMMRQMESRVLDRLDDVTRQLDQLTERLDRVGGGEQDEGDPALSGTGSARTAAGPKRNGEEHP